MESNLKTSVLKPFITCLGIFLFVASGECRRPPQQQQDTQMPPIPTDPEACYLPEKPEPCLAYIPRFHFDITTGQCHEFIWGGCQANANNFQTEDECLRFRNFCLRNERKSGKRMTSSTSTTTGAPIKLKRIQI
ncbi:unnamed protein product [Orchesella dallaii]|uniref:BPTI/Kunitz inhibitor domain-containing protein n=1 Tax=Orchesella dallaii TaxID=48710 RepID=A0ABP1S2L3_9HEXA